MNKASSTDREVYKLVRVHMNELEVGDLFCLNDPGTGPELLNKIYLCKSRPTLCVEVEDIHANI